MEIYDFFDIHQRVCMDCGFPLPTLNGSNGTYHQYMAKCCSFCEEKQTRSLYTQQSQKEEEKECALRLLSVKES